MQASPARNRMNRGPRFGGRVRGAPRHAAAGHDGETTSEREFASQSLPARPSLANNWRNKYLETLHIKGSRSAGPMGPGSGAGMGAGAGSGARTHFGGRAGRRGSTNSRPLPLPGRRPDASLEPSPAPSRHTPTRNAKSPEGDDFLYLEDDVFGWSNAVDFEAEADDGEDDLEREDHVGAMRGSHRPRFGAHGNDDAEHQLSSSFVPPHQLVARDCFSLGVRREFRATKAPM